MLAQTRTNNPANQSLALNVRGAIQGQVRSLTIQEAENLQFVSHDKILTWEGIVENIGKPNAQVHLIDTEVYEGHYGYVQQALGRGSAYTQSNFFNEVQFPSRRVYMPFLVFDFRDRPLLWKGKSYRWVMNIRRYNYTDTHQGLADMLIGLKNLLAERLMPRFNEPLLFVYVKPGSFRRPHINQLTEVKAAGFDVITETEMIESAGGALTSVLNPGTAIGYLKLVRVNESTDGLTPRHIAVFEDTPEHIPPVTGIVTLEPQTPLSHVNLLAKNRGTPNISTAKIDLIPNLGQLFGKLVKIVANSNGSIVVREVRLAEAQKFWDSKIPQKLDVPKITATSLEPIEFAIASESDRSLPNIGSKASNYGVIQTRLDPQVIKPGFALSFAHYQRIVSEPATQALIEQLLATKKALTPEAINDQLKRIRDSIKNQTSESSIAASLHAIRTIISKIPDVPRIRLRSSTNSEDLPTFNGAGLYESKGFNVIDGDEKLKKKLLKVMASLWLERAFWEREIFGIDHADVGMAVLINPAFSDEFGNGVVIGTPEGRQFKTWVNAQKGEASVTNPLDDEISESFTVIGSDFRTLEVQSRSNLGSVFLEDHDNQINNRLAPQLLQLRSITEQLHTYFVGLQHEKGDHRNYGIDIEYKLMQEGSQVVLYIKQSRLLNLGGDETPSAPKFIKVVAKDNGMGGAHLRRLPRQLSELNEEEFCVLKTDQVVGASTVEHSGNGFLKINVMVPSRSCPDFTGELYIYERHFNLT